MKKTILLLIIPVFILSCRESKEENDLDDVLRLTITQSIGEDGINSLQLPDESSLAQIPQDPKNPLSSEKVELGKLLFHETGIGLDAKQLQGAGTFSCASCHHAAAGFQAGMAQGIGDGGLGFGLNGEGRAKNPDYTDQELDIQMFRSPSVMNIAYQENILWNGQFGATGPNVGTESKWVNFPLNTNKLGYEGTETQAIAGLTVHRMDPANSLCATNPEYLALFNKAFPGKTLDLETAGLAIAAYERTVLSNQAPFQLWLRGEKNSMSDIEKRGAIIFFSKGKCYTCHNGPALSSMEFHALGMEDLSTATGAVIRPGELSPLGRASFTGRTEDEYRFKVPQLYNLKDSPFYGHGASFNSIKEVVEYKNQAVPENNVVPKSKLADEFVPLGLTEVEINELTAFLAHALHDDNLTRYLPSELPSGKCFPNADPQSQKDLFCQ